MFADLVAISSAHKIAEPDQVVTPAPSDGAQDRVLATELEELEEMVANAENDDDEEELNKILTEALENEGEMSTEKRLSLNSRLKRLSLNSRLKRLSLNSRLKRLSLNSRMKRLSLNSRLKRLSLNSRLKRLSLNSRLKKSAEETPVVEEKRASLWARTRRAVADY